MARSAHLHRRWMAVILARQCWQRNTSSVLWASGVSELRPGGGGGSDDLDRCGRLADRDERPQGVLWYISRSLVSAPVFPHSGSRWRRPAAGWGRETKSCFA